MHNGSLNLVFEYCVTDMERVINDKAMVLDAAYPYPYPYPYP